MSNGALATVAAIPLLLLGYCSLAETSYTARMDVEGNDLVAPLDTYRHELETRNVGGLEFVRIGKDVYQVSSWERRLVDLCA